MEQRWIILRTSGRHTLRLAETLASAGFETWTPRETKRIRVPRANVRREVTLPIMPSYVFAAADGLLDLLALADKEFKPHADFTVMRFHSTIPLIADAHLTALKQLEAKRAPRKKAVRFDRGVDVLVKIEGGSFAGMRGRVEQSDENMTLVCFDRRMTVKIPTFLLAYSDVQSANSLAVDHRKAA